MIKAGDLVMVVRQPCCGSLLGKTFRVGCITVHAPGIRCTDCGVTHADMYIAQNETMVEGQICAASTTWLKRIPPLDELEGEKRREELTA